MTYVDEIADACIFFLNKKTKHSLINIGSGFEKPIKEFILLIAKKMKLKSKIVFNNDKSLDGTPRKIVDCKIARSYGWKPKYNFNKCLDFTIEDFKKNQKKYLS
jgi:GDP-L-fucose synthase